MIVAAVVIATTGYEAADPIASLVIGLLILPRTWHPLRNAVDVPLEATPKDVDLDEVRHILDRGGGRCPRPAAAMHEANRHER